MVMNRAQCDSLVVALDHYQACAEPPQQLQAARIAEFVRAYDAPWRRSTLRGHLTASAWIVDESRQHALLLHHKKLDGWFQPGGHIDDDDVDILAAAFREAFEETGLTDLAVIANKAGSHIFDVDVHKIPERGDEPTHFHYDIRFCFVAKRGAAFSRSVDEANDLRWFSLRALAEDATIDTSVRRMAALSLTRTA